MSKISELSDGGSLQSTDYLIAVRSGGNVKVRPNGAVSGTTGQFSTSLNVDGTVTADGLTVDGNSYSQTYRSSRTDGDVYIQAATDVDFVRIGTQTKPKLLNIDGTGDISFYEDTGTTPKFFWDASAEALQLKSGSLLELERPDGAISSKIYMQAGASGGLAFDNLNGDGFEFKYAGADQVVIDSSGNVGIGTASPQKTLDVAGTLAISNSPTSYWDFDRNDSDGSLVISDTGSEKMRIDSSGNLFVGTTVTYPGVSGLGGNIKGMMSEGGGSLFLSRVDSNPVLYINRGGTDGDSVRFAKDAGSTVGSISVTATTTTYNITSDQRLKENIVDAPSASEDIDAIQVRSFDWKADGSHQRYGMVAQELLEVAPEAVSGDPESDDMMGVDYSKLVPMLVKEIQSLRARVAQLEGA